MKKLIILLHCCLLFPGLYAQSFITEKKEAGAFPIATGAQTATIYVDEHDDATVRKAAALLQQDIEMVTGKKPVLTHALSSVTGQVIIIGSIGQSTLIQQLIQEKKINATGLTGQWEAYRVQTLVNPVSSIQQALVITGSDRRGAAYGVFELSRQIGVSPWYWWADVPVNNKKELYVKKGVYQYHSPAVKYRGIFINDEAPALSGWSKEKFGGFNHLFYEKVFELMLRLKANYLWPAMWGNAFYDDDTLNKQTADEYGIVIGTSHHEPLLRAHDEWRRYGSGKWNYDSNAVQLQEFWKEGIRRALNTETIVSIGMRGDGDEPMTEGTAIALLERIVKDQRTIISNITGKEAAATPQLWALYKEVQDYYDKGMRVPDDVTLLLCDDNWGNIRKLPKAGEKSRKGGYGIYYHFDYVGGPRNYKWINTNPIARVWEQMHLAYEYGVDRIWIVNVGDIKPMEFPISFFLDYAWNPAQWKAGKLDDYTRQWAAQQFGPEHAAGIAELLTKYAMYNSRRKPELLSPDTYSLLHYREAENIITAFDQLVIKAEKIYKELPDTYKDAYYQLVLHPVTASANLNKLYVAAAKNRLYDAQGRAATNTMADSVRILFENDSLITDYYNNQLSGGKWHHMMDQTHIGYTYWQQPPRNRMPEVKRISIPENADMAVAIEGSASWWPSATQEAVLPAMHVSQPANRYIEVFNRGQKPFDYTVTTGVPWLQVMPSKGNVAQQERLWITANWQKVPAGKHHAPITITGPGGRTITVTSVINKPLQPAPNINTFVETNGYVSMEAEQFTKAIAANPVKWQVIPDLGRTLSGVTAFPVTAPSSTPGANSPRLEYEMYFSDSGMVTVHTYCSPTLDFHNTGGLRYGISFDDEPVQIINLHENNSNRTWEQWVANNIIIKRSQHQLNRAGRHVLKFWRVDAGVVLQKLVVDAGGVQQSYLGPPGK